MRHIDKMDPPQVFEAFIESNRPSKWEDLHKVRPPIYSSVCTALADEQNSLCGYTELPLKIHNQHIDHYYKRALFPKECFNWENLILAVRDESFGANFKDKRINNRESYDGILNPVVNYPEEYFEYDYLGEISPKSGLAHRDREKACKTIDVFNLNDRKLVNRRRDIVIAYDSFIKGGLSGEEIKRHLKEDGFVSLIDQLHIVFSSIF